VDDPREAMSPPDALPGTLILFTLDGFHFALEALQVERVARAVEIVPVPDLPRGVRGVVHVRGQVVPVLDLRVRLGLAAREIRLSDHFIVLRSAGRQLAVMVDDVTDVVPAAQVAMIAAPAVLPGLAAVEGWVKVKGELIMIHDVEKFLTTEEMAALELAMRA
jgi:purine-binding chemotaxis protein CheW